MGKRPSFRRWRVYHLDVERRRLGRLQIVAHDGRKPTMADLVLTNLE
jgi:hypothetical protein